MNPVRHKLTITPGTPGSTLYKAYLQFPDGTEMTLYADERARIIAKAQAAIVEHDTLQLIPDEETLYLNHAGEIIREPTEWSTRA